MEGDSKAAQQERPGSGETKTRLHVNESGRELGGKRKYSSQIGQLS